jgi:U3 small nucleolar RNA-associated protein 15
MLLKHVTDPRFSSIASYMITLVLGRSLQSLTQCILMTIPDMYADVIGQSPLIDNLLVRLRRKVTAEIRFQEVVARTLGALDMVFCESSSINKAS